MVVPNSGVPSFPLHLLIDFPNWLGDLAMSLPAADLLIEANRGGRTILHCRPSSARLLQSLYPGARIVIAQKKESAGKSASRLRESEGPIDLGLTFRNALRAKAMLRMSCGWSAGTSNQGGWALLSFSHTVDRSRHQVHDADALLRHLHLEEAGLHWKASLPSSLLGEGESALAGAGLQPGMPRIALAPGVALGGSAKQWASEKFGRLAAELRARSYQPFIAIGPGERSLAEAICRASSFSLPILGENFDAAGLASLLHAAHVVLGNDSGPAHLAAVFGIPVVALFGPTDPTRTAPLGERSRVLTLELPCSPCNHRRCPEGHERCLKDLDITHVFTSLEQNIEKCGLNRRMRQQHRPRVAARNIVAG